MKNLLSFTMRLLYLEYANCPPMLGEHWLNCNPVFKVSYFQAGNVAGLDKVIALSRSGFLAIGPVSLSV